MKNNIDYSLYICTDRGLMTSATIEESVESALKGGATLVQLREKCCSGREFYRLGLRVKEITSKYNVPLIINDRVDIAMAVKADGIHIGQSDLPCRVVRSIVGDGMVIGVSASCTEEAVQAEKDGADYIGVGAMYATRTKTDAKAVSMEELCKIREAVAVPIVVIGGINKETVPEFKGMGIDGIAVVSAVISQPDVEAAAKELLELFRNSTGAHPAV